MKQIKFVIVFFLFLTEYVYGLEKEDLYPFGTEHGDRRLAIGDDLSSSEIYLDTEIAFYDNKYKGIYVNMNGILSFNTDLSSYRSNLILPIGQKLIAPFFADVDIGLSGNVYYRETEDPALLDKAGQDIRQHFRNAENFRPYNLFIVTWDTVGYYDSQFDQTNTFQVVIASDGSASYVFFHYPRDGIQWVTGMGKTVLQGNPDVPAQVGFDAGDRRRSFLLQQSGKPIVRTLDESSNVNIPGVWMFKIGNTFGGEIEIPGGIESAPESCSTGGSRTCSGNADCIDYASGFCCKCSAGFYGNGINCLKPGDAQRLSGKVKGVLNGQNIDSVDLHAFVVTNDGRSFTAMSRIPPPLGYSVQSLYAVGDVLGWLYALPLSPKAKNGYAMTGGDFNRTVLISFANNNERVTINQRAQGNNAQGYMRMDTDIEGDVPAIPADTKVAIEDFTQEYRRQSPGVIKSFSTRMYLLNNVPQRFNIDETIRYTECKANPLNDVDVMRLSVSRTFVAYESKDEIVRFATTNRVGRAAGGNPCIEQGLNCDSNADCVPSGAFFKCQCRQGYTGNGEFCQDVDECTDGSANCHPELGKCTNTPGSYECACLPGFKGDGRRCARDQTCADKVCHPYARCVYDSETFTAKCECGPGFYGDGVTLCSKVDDQDCSVLNNCDRNARCLYDESTFKHECVCNRGYHGDGYRCDADTCDIANNCDRNAQCLYNPNVGRFECLCNPGFQGNGLVCVEESCNVRDNCDENAQCVYKYETSRYTCQCNEGFEGDGKTCTQTAVQCNQVNNCDPNADCLFDRRSNQYYCRCRQGYEGDGYRCTLTANCRDNPRLCDANARCQRSGLDFVCVCNPGYRGDGYRCTSTSASGDYLLVNQGMSILEVPFQANSNSAGKLILHVPGQLAVGIDVDCYERYFYWTDAIGKIISRAKMDGTDSDVLIENLGSPEGIAIDWISRNMYYTDSGLDTISVAKLDGSERKVLISTDLVNPRAIAVDPVKGVMFWTDWNRQNPKIERANMDGTGRVTLVSDGLQLPNGLTIDPALETICWADAGTRKIECYGYEPNLPYRERKVIYNEASYPFSLAYADGNFYWTDWQQKTLPHINEYAQQPGVPIALPLGGNGKLYGLVAVKNQCPGGTNACTYNNGGCRFLCLPGANGRRTCVCPDNIEEEECNRIGLLL